MNTNSIMSTLFAEIPADFAESLKEVVLSTEAEARVCQENNKIFCRITKEYDEEMRLDFANSLSKQLADKNYPITFQFESYFPDRSKEIYFIYPNNVLHLDIDAIAERERKSLEARVQQNFG